MNNKKWGKKIQKKMKISEFFVFTMAYESTTKWKYNQLIFILFVCFFLFFWSPFNFFALLQSVFKVPARRSGSSGMPLQFCFDENLIRSTVEWITNVFSIQIISFWFKQVFCLKKKKGKQALFFNGWRIVKD